MSSEQVADRYLIRLEVRKVVAKPSFRSRLAAVPDLTPAVLEAFVDAFAVRRNGRIAFLGGIAKKLSKLIDLFKKVPQAWAEFKKMIGVEHLTDIPGALKKLAKEGLEALKRLLRRAAETFPLALTFLAPKLMPTLTDLIKRIIGENSTLNRALSAIQAGAVRVDVWLDKYVPVVVRRPLLAAIYIFCWWNVAELSADWSTDLQGFLGGVSLGAMFKDLPEWGLSFIANLAGLNWGAIPLILIARIVWLVGKRYLEWVPGKGLKGHWDKIKERTGEAPELIPVF